MLVASCSGRVAKPVVNQSAQAGLTPNASMEIRNATDARVALRTACETYKPWTQAKIPVTLNLTAPKTISAKGTLEMVRGKSLMLSLRYFGFEIGWLAIDNDRIIVVDKIHKSYIEESITTLLKGFPATIANLQDLLMGRPFIAGSTGSIIDSVNRLDIQWDTDDNLSWFVVPPQRAPGVDYGFVFTSESLTSLVAQVNGGQPVTVSYSPDKAAVVGAIASETAIAAKTAKSEINVAIDFNLDKASWNENANLRSVRLPSGYKKINASEILKLISSM